jgi:hypothetical protein
MELSFTESVLITEVFFSCVTPQFLVHKVNKTDFRNPGEIIMDIKY